MTRIILLTGPKRSGKTTACRRFVENGRRANMAIGGIVSPARYDHRGQKRGIDIIDLTTGQRRALATTASSPQEATVGKYRFYPGAIRWARRRALSALAAPLDVVIVDEIGPLELEQKQGFATALDRLSTSRAKIAILIVRDSLVSQLQEKLKALQPETMHLCNTNRNQIPHHLYKMVRDLLSPPRD
ncbi:MAG: nucleoside-triphosphatase [Chloroflexota bacterium]|nr:nucleoside-triphosphatase [Chloroflexota bacterium]